MLIIHGDDDQIVPIDDSARLSVEIVKGATLRVIAGAPHGLCTTDKDLNQCGTARVLQRRTSGYSVVVRTMLRMLIPMEAQDVRRLKVGSSRSVPTEVSKDRRILNPLARNQIQGAVVMGIGMALFEETTYDPRTARRSIATWPTT